jgi:alkaline phosphatase D
MLVGMSGNWDKRRLETTNRLGSIAQRQFMRSIRTRVAELIFGACPLLERIVAAPRFSGYPFSLGIASGDPLPDGVVLWTRLAPEPLAADGRGGMPEESISVRWEMAADENFSRVVHQGTVRARPELAHSVHVEVEGLEPTREYYYRFKAGSEVSPVGRTKTAPALGNAVCADAFRLRLLPDVRARLLHCLRPHI